MLTQTKIDEIVDRVIKIGHPKFIYIFGSYVYGDPNENSDLDLLVVKSHVLNKRQELLDLKRSLISEDYSLDLLLYSEDEFEEKKSQHWSLLEDIDKRGKKSLLNDKRPEYWFELAKHDHETAILLEKHHGYPDIIIYHFHQAIEKSLKGHILKNNAAIVYIHDLERLYKILSIHNNHYEGIADDIIIIQSMYRDLSYPQSDMLNDSDLIEAEKSYSNIRLFLAGLED